MRGYQAAPFVVPFVKVGAPGLQGRPRCMVAWLKEYTPARWLKTSSSGVREGVDVNCWKTAPTETGMSEVRRSISIHQEVEDEEGGKG